MAWIFENIFIFSVLSIIDGSRLTYCPKFTRQIVDVGIRNPSNFTGNCPMAYVLSEESCLRQFCNIIQSDINCNGNAVQFLATDGDEGICYILQLLHKCTPATGCQLTRENNSKLYLTDRSIDIDVLECPNEHKCEDGECVSHLTRCDGVIDCSDGSDEYTCGDTVPCNFEDDAIFGCRTGKACIPQSLVCDGKISCPDGSDEMGCYEYLRKRHTSSTMMITAIAVGAILSLLLIVLMFACGQKLYRNHFQRRERLRNLRLGSSGADYVVSLLPGDAPFQDTLPPSYTDSVHVPTEEPPGYRPSTALERLLDIAEASGYISPHSAKNSTLEVETNSPKNSTCESESDGLTSNDGPGPAILSEKVDSLTEELSIRTDDVDVT